MNLWQNLKNSLNRKELGQSKETLPFVMIMRYGWLILIDEDDIVHCGSSDTIPCHYKSDRYRQGIAEGMRRRNCYCGEVYFLSDSLYTQDVCEMNMGRFVDYIRKHGKRYA